VTEIQRKAYEAIANAANEMAEFYASKDAELSEAIQNAKLSIAWVS
jgi:hypothetical protein